MANACAFWCNSITSKSKQHDNVLMQNWNVILLNLISFLPEASMAIGYCRCLRLSVRPCVNHLLVRAITRDPFKLGSPNLNHRCKRGSTLYSEGSFVRRFFGPKPFEVAMVRRTYGPKVLYSEVPLLRKLLRSEDYILRKALHYIILCYEDSLVRSSFSPKGAMFRTSIFRNRPSPIWVLYYEGPLVRSSPSSKIAMFRRFYLPNFARSIRILCHYEGSSWWYLNFSGHKILPYWYSVFILL